MELKLSICGLALLLCACGSTPVEDRTIVTGVGATADGPEPSDVPTPAMGSETFPLADETRGVETTGEPGGFAPQGNWKAERKRLAMRGLRYDSGRVCVDETEGPGVLASLGDASVPAIRTSLLREGRVALGENRALDAIALFTRLVLLEPRVAEHYVPLGRALLSFNLEAQAIAAWETGLELDPEHAQLNFHVADMAYRGGDRARARQLFERATRVDPNHGPAWGRLARMAFLEGSDEAAWHAVHRAESAGETVPKVLRARLAARSPEPRR